MITIFHGDNTAQSRKQYSDVKHDSLNPIVFEGSSVTVTDLAQALEGQGLFGETRDLYIEEFFSKRKPSKETDALLLYLHNHEKSHKIAVWESKTLTPAQIKAYVGAAHATIQKFDFPKILFSFLDSILPGNGQKTISLFHQTLETEEAEFVFFMIVRHVRILLAQSDSTENEPIDEVKRLAPWQKGKLQKQLQAFGQKRLIDLYNQLFTIEQGMKTGTLALSVVEAIDFLLIKL